jgi:phosphoadenosine phosphosulfate reductase
MATPARRPPEAATDPTSGDRIARAEARAAELLRRYDGLDGLDLLRPIVRDEFPGRIAVSSSFGAEAAVMLDLVAQADPATPVIFLDTGKLFGETIRYRQTLTALLGLADVRIVRPKDADVQTRDPDGILWMQDPDACCALRKVEPFARALDGFDAWVTGRKRFHGGQRGRLPTIEADAGRVKINPLATWSRERILAHFSARHLPPHPLVADGYLSIGCMPCTERVKPGQGVRDGRWAGQDKDECGIHLPIGGGLGL